MAIADDSIGTDVWNSIRTKIVAVAPYVTNSSSSTDTTAASINSSYNDKAATRPQVVINPAMIDEDTWKFGGAQGRKVINVVVECWHKNTRGIDQMWDQVRSTLDDNDIDGMDLIGISTDYGFNSPGDQKAHVKSGTFTYMRE